VFHPLTGVIFSTMVGDACAVLPKRDKKRVKK